MMQLSSTDQVDRILVAIDSLKRLSWQVLEHTENVRESVTAARWALHLCAKQQAKDALDVVTSSLPQDSAEAAVRDHDPSAEAFADTFINTTTCVCGGSDSGLMIMCNNAKCPYQWFHLECAGLQEVPEGEWLCPICTL